MNYLPYVGTGAIVFALVLFILYVVKTKKLDQIRKVCWDLFQIAENMFLISGAGKLKMEWVFEKAYVLIPNWLKFVISEEKFRELLQLWFDEIKDYLDDGKLNHSIQNESSKDGGDE